MGMNSTQTSLKPKEIPYFSSSHVGALRHIVLPHLGKRGRAPVVACLGDRNGSNSLAVASAIREFMTHKRKSERNKSEVLLLHPKGRVPTDGFFVRHIPDDLPIHAVKFKEGYLVLFPQEFIKSGFFSIYAEDPLTSFEPLKHGANVFCSFGRLMPTTYDDPLEPQVELAKKLIVMAHSVLPQGGALITQTPHSSISYELKEWFAQVHAPQVDGVAVFFKK